jgi:hypothetical protein
VVMTSAETALGSLYDLETSLYPRTALCKGENERSPFSSECQGRGRGSPRVPSATLAAYTEPERMSNQRGRRRVYGLWALVRSRRSATVSAEHHRQAHPVLVQ